MHITSNVHGYKLILLKIPASVSGKFTKFEIYHFDRETSIIKVNTCRKACRDVNGIRRTRLLTDKTARPITIHQSAVKVSRYLRFPKDTPTIRWRIFLEASKIACNHLQWRITRTKCHKNVLTIRNVTMTKNVLTTKNVLLTKWIILTTKNVPLTKWILTTKNVLMTNFLMSRKTRTESGEGAGAKGP